MANELIECVFRRIWMKRSVLRASSWLVQCRKRRRSQSLSRMEKLQVSYPHLGCTLALYLRYKIMLSMLGMPQCCKQTLDQRLDFSLTI